MEKHHIPWVSINQSFKRFFFISGLLLATSLINTGCSTILTAASNDEIKLHPGKRTFGAIIDDEHLETIAKVNINKAHPDLKKAHLNVTSFNRVILLTGQVKSVELRQLAGETITRIRKVRQVYNELQIQNKPSILARTNDSWLTTKVKSRLLANENIDSGRVKVVTEDGAVFLMGLLTHDEASRAAEVARTTGGVQKVVKAIEYID